MNSIRLAADRLDMAHGVEVRLPYLDHVLFERLARVPLAVLITPDVEKRLLRDAMRPFLAGSAFRRPKKPFWAPPEATRGSSRLNTLVQDTLRGTTARSLPFFRPRGTGEDARRPSNVLPRARGLRRLAASRGDLAGHPPGSLRHGGVNEIKQELALTQSLLRPTRPDA